MVKTTISRVRSGGGAGVRRLTPRKLALAFLKVVVLSALRLPLPFPAAGSLCLWVAFGVVQGLERCGAR